MPSPWLRASLEENQLIFCVSTWHAVPIFPSRANLMHIKANKLNVILWSFGQVQHPMCTGLRNWTEMERHFLIKSREGAVPKWWKNRMGRPLSSSQTHRKKKKKIIWMWSNFHKTTSECWRRTPDTQKGSPISSKLGEKALILFFWRCEFYWEGKLST